MIENPRYTAQYRASTNNMKSFNHRQKQCTKCKFRRSEGQFAADPTVCNQCVRRG